MFDIHLVKKGSVFQSLRTYGHVSKTPFFEFRVPEKEYLYRKTKTKFRGITITSLYYS